MSISSPLQCFILSDSSSWELPLCLLSTEAVNLLRLYSLITGEHPDHVVVIKYVPYVADSKRAMDEYSAEIFMGGRQTIVMHNTCEDSLLAAPIILDLVILAGLLTLVIMATICLQYCHLHTLIHLHLQPICTGCSNIVSFRCQQFILVPQKLLIAAWDPLHYGPGLVAQHQ